MDALLIADWQRANPHAFIALELALTAKTLRLTSGGVAVFGGETYGPKDDDYGVLSAVGSITDGLDGVASAPDITLMVKTDAALAALSADQGAFWTLYWGSVSPSTGAVVGTPETLSSGYINTITPTFAAGARPVVIKSYTDEQRMLLRDASKGWSAAHHRSVWSGEAGFDELPGVKDKVYWRANEPN